MLPKSGKSYADLPGGSDAYFDRTYGERKPNYKRLAVAVSLVLGTIGMLYKPAFQHYQRIAHDCSKTLSVDQRAQRVLTTTPLIGKKFFPRIDKLNAETNGRCALNLDGHVDLAIFLRGVFDNHIDSDDFTGAFENGTLSGHLDLARLRAGRAGGAFWSVFAPCPADGDDFSDENYAASKIPLTFRLILVHVVNHSLFDDRSSIHVAGNRHHEEALHGLPR
jgi:membrane dipeptidase